jgi:hypothetical protein
VTKTPGLVYEKRAEDARTRVLMEKELMELERVILVLSWR